MNVLFHQAALGDFALTFPLIRAMKGDTTVIAPWQKAALAGATFKHVQPLDIELFEFTRLYAEGGPTSISPAVADVFSQATLIVSFVSRGDDVWASNVRRLAPQARLAFAHTRPPADFHDHVTIFHREQLKHQGVELPNARLKAWRHADGPVLLHPGSGGAGKIWPAERFAELAQRLIARGLSVRFVLGEVEMENPSLAAELGQAAEIVPCRTTLDLLDQLESARLFVGNDAGPTHLRRTPGTPDRPGRQAWQHGA